LKKILTLKLYITLWETYSKRIVWNKYTLLSSGNILLFNFIWKYFNAFNNGRRQ